MKIGITVCSALLGMMLLVESTYAAHPLITDDVGTQGKGTFQLEVNTEFARDEEAEAGAVTEEKGMEASAVLSYGILETLDIVVGLPYTRIEVKENANTVLDEQGLSDASLELKWRFFEAGGTNFALKPGVSFPTGDEKKGLGTGKYGLSLFLIADREADALTFHLNLGYYRNNNRFEEKENLWHASLAAELKASEAVRIVGNIGIEENPDTASDTDPAFALAGIIYAVSENFDIDLGYKVGLSSAETDSTVLAGMAFRF